MHISYESGILEDPSQPAPDDLYQMTKSPQNTPNSPVRLDIVFKNGLVVRCSNPSTGSSYEQPLHIMQFLNQIGGEHGVGRIDIVENRFVGLKSRGVYETPGCKILYEAHLDLEVYCLDREVLRIKSYLADKMAEYVYNGFWYSPEAEYVKKCLDDSQKNVNGRVIVELFKGNVFVVARESTSSLYNQELVSMNAHGQLNYTAATGFIEINAIRLKESHRVTGVTPNHVRGVNRVFSRVNLN